MPRFVWQDANVPLTPLTSHHWWQVSWVDWAQAAGVLIALVGLALTFWQARGAKNNAHEAGIRASEAKAAAEATTAAVDRTQRQLRANQVLVLLPQLRWLAHELDSAIANDDRDLARRQLDNWRWQAGHANGLLTEITPSPRKILRALQDSVALATEATTTLMKQEKAVMESCEPARGAIGEACNLLNVFIGANATQVQPIPELEQVSDEQR